MINSLASMLSSSKKPKQNTTECTVNGAGTIIEPWVLKVKILPCRSGKTDSTVASHLKTKTDQLHFMLMLIWRL